LRARGGAHLRKRGSFHAHNPPIRNDVQMRIIIGGASGFLGTALIERLRADGHEVTRLVRRTAKGPGELRWSPADGVLDPKTLTGADVAINLAGAGVGDHRWTRSYMEVIRRSRVDSTTTLSHALTDAVSGPRVLLNASAVGFYGSRGDEILTEQSPAGDGFLPDVCRAWESATQAAEDAGVRVCHLRSGLVLGGGGGLLGRMVPLFRAGLGGKLGDGRQWMSWVSLADELNAIRFLMSHDDIAGPVNVTGPNPVRNEDLTRILGAVLKRPTLLPAPKLGLRIVLGQFTEDVLSSTRAMPSVLTAAGFRHEHDDVESALKWAVGASS
jgi:uncharacterized protein (TIGR01777 family)